MLKRRRTFGRQGSAAVEFAMVSTFLLLPLFGGGADFVEMISAQAQLNTALQSLYYFAYTNPGNAANATQLTAMLAKINSAAVHQVAMPSAAVVSYKCISSAGVMTTNTSATCASGTAQTYVTYQLTSSVALTAPLPLAFRSPFQMSAKGTVQIQ